MKKFFNKFLLTALISTLFVPLANASTMMLARYDVNNLPLTLVVTDGSTTADYIPVYHTATNQVEKMLFPSVLGTTATAAELNVLHGVTPGTAAASKAVVLDSSKNIATIGTIGSGAITSSGAISGTTITGSGALQGTAVTATTGDITATAGNFVVSAANKGLSLKTGSNGKVGTFTCTSGGDITISNTGVAITDAVIISLNTVGGTVSTAPAVKSITASTGFHALCASSDTSVYNYAIISQH